MTIIRLPYLVSVDVEVDTETKAVVSVSTIGSTIEPAGVVDSDILLDADDPSATLADIEKAREIAEDPNVTWPAWDHS